MSNLGDIANKTLYETGCIGCRLNSPVVASVKLRTYLRAYNGK